MNTREELEAQRSLKIEEARLWARRLFEAEPESPDFWFAMGAVRGVCEVLYGINAQIEALPAEASA